MNLRTLCLAASVGALLIFQPYRPFVVSGDSMDPTLASGQWILGDSHPGGVARNDVVVFRLGSETMVKRVAFLPGDRIERYWFGGRWIMPANVVARDSLVRNRHPRRDLVVPPGHLFVVGDNFYESIDSRSYGAIPMRDILAVVTDVRACSDPWTVPSHLTAHLAAGL